ncbi:hypothetical protein ACN38_g2818 [Penicillium nordicum]|uniref:Uncharacterized protein n=1 Tax=Penicillium nordicum TaxID=229535 RepID=A0A0M8P6C5_9EURO|nr:hypothetical protein ACN38_g2818 [Penicillium nordicum]
MSLEQYMHSSEIYRSVSVTSPLPLPVKMETVPALEQKIRPLYPEIQAIMRRHNLNVTTTFQCGKMSKPRYPGGDVALNFFCIYLSDSESSIPPLGPVKDDIVKLFYQHEVNAHVQVMSSRNCHRPFVSFIASSHTLVMAYQRTKRIIVSLLNRTIGNKWHLLCPFNVGSAKAKAEPMIVVLVEPWTRANWFELRAQIMYQLAPHTNTDKFDIEFLPGTLSRLTNGGVSFADRLTPNAIPRMGYSIGIEGVNNAGTLGGFVTLTHGGTVRRGFLTNYHVIRPSESKDNAQFLEGLDRYGSSPARPLNQVVRMECLARMDRDSTLARLKSSLNAMREQHSEISAKVQERELVGATPHPRLLEWIENYDSHMEKLLSRHAAVERMPHVLGEMKFVSGEQLRNRRLLDWAFVQLSREAEEQCFRPNRMFQIPPAFLPESFTPPRPTMVIKEHDVLNEFGSLKAGDYCVKNGRTTGVTAGICNGPKAYCNWKFTTPTRYSPSGEPVDMSTTATEEFIIVTEGPELGQPRRAFCYDGDSGSFILNGDGAVTGLLWGGVSHEDLDVGLASSMPDVMESIKEKIGGLVSVELPQ